MKINSETENIEILKIVYDKVAEHHKYFLSWRHYLLAGYFVVLSSLCFACFYLIEKGGPFDAWSFLIPIVIGTISRFFLFMEKRNIDLYHDCQNVGKRIEKELFEKTKPKIKKNRALFITLSSSYKNSRFTHSQLIGYVYNSISIISFLISVILFIFLTLDCCIRFFK